MADSVEKAPRIHVMAHACLARILVRQGEPARAAEIARRGVTLATTEQPRLYATASLAECELAAGAFERALEAGTQVATVVSARGVGHYVGDVLGSTVAVEALRALGREDDARAAIDLPLSLLRARTNSVSPRRRRAMLERVEDNRRALEVARLLGVPTGDISGI
jgi:ATP/maltotriose-dependent transcriptional regulator MalT